MYLLYLGGPYTRCELLKPLYGLSPECKEWCAKLANFLMDIGGVGLCSISQCSSGRMDPLSTVSANVLETSVSVVTKMDIPDANRDFGEKTKEIAHGR